MAIPIPTFGAITSGIDASMETAAPAGVASGDLLVGAAMVEFSVIITNPPGWTELVNAAHSGSSSRLWVGWRVADGTAADTPIITCGGSVSNWKTVLARVTGADTANPFSVAVITAQTTGTSHALPSAMTADANCLLLAFAGLWRAAITAYPTGWTVGADNQTSSILLGLRRDAATIGTYGGETYTTSFSSDSVEALLAIAPAVGGGPTFTPAGLWFTR